MGRETTNNPVPAAAALLGRKKVGHATRALRRMGRKRAHKGNPLPAVVGVLGGIKQLGGVFGRFGPPSEKRAAGVASQLVTAAIGGNLTAAKTILDRT